MTGERGLSTSASLLVIFVGLFVAMGTLYTVTANTVERVADANADRRQHQRAVAATAVNVTEATWDTADANLTLRVTNTGERTLPVAAADTVVDGAYVGIDAYERVAVDGVDTTVWPPGETLVLEDADTVTSQPARVRFVTGVGVADTAAVVGA